MRNNNELPNQELILDEIENLHNRLGFDECKNAIFIWFEAAQINDNYAMTVQDRFNYFQVFKELYNFHLKIQMYLSEDTEAVNIFDA